MATFNSTAPETWYPVPEFPKYELSSHLRLRTYHQGKRRRTHEPRLIKIHTDDRGYAKLILWRDEKYHNLYLHRLVALLAFGPCPDGQIVRHLDDDKTNNWPSNLAYGTQSDNVADCISNGHFTTLRGAERVNAKLTDSMATAIIRLADYGIDRGVLSECFDIDRSTICRILHGERWSHIT